MQSTWVDLSTPMGLQTSALEQRHHRYEVHDSWVPMLGRQLVQDVFEPAAGPALA